MKKDKVRVQVVIDYEFDDGFFDLKDSIAQFRVKEDFKNGILRGGELYKMNVNDIKVDIVEEKKLRESLAAMVGCFKDHSIGKVDDVDEPEEEVEESFGSWLADIFGSKKQ